MSQEIMEKLCCPLCGSETFVTDENCAEEPARYCTSQDCDWYGSVNMIEYTIVDKVLGLSIEYDHPSYSNRLRNKERLWEAMQAVGCLVDKEIERLLAAEREKVRNRCIEVCDRHLSALASSDLRRTILSKLCQLDLAAPSSTEEGGRDIA